MNFKIGNTNDAMNGDESSNVKDDGFASTTEDFFFIEEGRTPY